MSVRPARATILDPEDGAFRGARADVHRGFDHRELAARMVRAGSSGIRFSAPCEIQRSTEDRLERFPLFLAVATR